MRAGPDDVLTILSISDIHLGHRRVDARVICANLATALFPRLPGLKLLVLGGDLFDAGLGFSDVSVQVLLEFFITLLKQCDAHGVTVVIVRGTYSHDRTQPERLVALHKSCGFTNELRYFDTVSLSYLEALDLRIVCIPDDMPYASSDAIIAHVREQMAELGWESVDYAFVHDEFAHAQPAGATHPPKVLFRAAQFDFVRRAVLSGHIHTASQFEHVYYNGSFERLAHGEEEDKGFLYLEDDRQTLRVKFIVNEHTTLFKTIDLTPHRDLDTALRVYREWLRDFDPERDANIRIMHPSPEVRVALTRYTVQSYPHFRVTHKPTTDPQVIVIDEPVRLHTRALTPPTPDTLPAMVVAWQAAHGKSGLSAERTAQLLTAFSK